MHLEEAEALVECRHRGDLGASLTKHGGERGVSNSASRRVPCWSGSPFTSAVHPKLHCAARRSVQLTLDAFQQAASPRGYCMLLWPLHTHTSPNMKSARVMVMPPDVTFRLCLSKLA